GLEAVVRSLTGAPPAAGGPSLEFAQHILLALYAALQNDQRREFLAVLDDIPWHTSPSTDTADVPPRLQLRATTALYTAVGAGTAVISIPTGRPSPEEFAHLL